MENVKSKLISITEYIDKRSTEGYITIEESLYEQWRKDLFETVGKIEAFEKSLEDAARLTYSVAEGDSGPQGMAFHRSAGKMNELLDKYIEL